MIKDLGKEMAAMENVIAVYSLGSGIQTIPDTKENRSLIAGAEDERLAAEKRKVSDYSIMYPSCDKLENLLKGRQVIEARGLILCNAVFVFYEF